jgi:hypothetical protein
LRDTRQQEDEMKIKLPFILVCVNNCNTNCLEFISEEERRKLSITSLEKLRCFGDGDILRMKKFGAIPCQDFEKFIGPEGKGIRKLLHTTKQEFIINKDQKKE